MKNFISRFRVYLPVILIIGVLLIPNIGFATRGDTLLDPGSDTLEGLADVLGLVISVLTFLALLMINFFGELLGTSMITGPEPMAAIQPMWMWIRNLTNILFVGVLLFLAFSNLFSSLGIGGEGGNWTIKEKLPKLIIAIVAINFSLLGFKVVIDAINVGTVAILGIADHRLEPDMTGITEVLSGTRTWIKIDGDRQKAIKKSLGDKNFKQEDLDVAGGNDCGTQWNTFITEDGMKCDSEDKSQCALFAKDGSDIFVCRGFTESINDLFCRDWIEESGDGYADQVGGDDKCLFMMKKDSFSTMITPKSEPGQNLFAAFGSVFMHLEKLPALGAEINSLGAVATNTLFSAILAIAFIVALVAVFIAMIVRVILLWIVLVFSPLLVGASILGVDGGKGGDISGKIVTHLIMPLKVAAAFAVGFVMMSTMVEWQTETSDTTFVFGPALSQLGVNEYAFLWQIATIVLFWMVAFWAVEGSLADKLIQGVKGAAETLATVTAKSLTVDRPMFTVGTGKNESKFSLGSVLSAPSAIANAKQARDNKMKATMAQAFGITQSDFAKGLQGKTFSSAADFKRYLLSAGSIGEAGSHYKEIAEALRNSSFAESTQLANSMLASGGDMKKFNEAITGNLSGHGFMSDPYLATPGSYGKSYSPGTSPAPKNKSTKVENITENSATVGETEITSSTSMQGLQNSAKNGVDSEDTAYKLLKIIQNTSGAAVPVVSGGVQMVSIVDKNKNRIDWNHFGEGTTVDKLNTETSGVNFAEIYKNSNDLTKNLIEQILEEKTGLKISWDGDKFIQEIE